MGNPGTIIGLQSAHRHYWYILLVYSARKIIRNQLGFFREAFSLWCKSRKSNLRTLSSCFYGIFFNGSFFSKVQHHSLAAYSPWFNIETPLHQRPETAYYFCQTIEFLMGGYWNQIHISCRSFWTNLVELDALIWWSIAFYMRPLVSVF